MTVNYLLLKLNELKNKGLGDSEIELEVFDKVSNIPFTAKLDEVFESTEEKIILQG